MKFTYRILLLSLLFLFFPALTFAYAEPGAPTSAGISSTWYLEAGLGSAWQRDPSGVSIADPGLAPDIYQPKSTKASFIVTATGGRRFTRESRILPSGTIGIGYFWNTSGRTKGNIIDNSATINYKYGYKLYNHIFTANIKLDLFNLNVYTPDDIHNIVAPYILVGLGVARNRVYNYTETPIAAVTRPSLAFASNWSTEFAYHLGAGFDWQFNDKYGASLGYQYTDAGEVELGTGPIRPGVKGPHQNVRLNTVLLTFWCLF